ncbi:MAG: sacsin N-terminal ATP-binding-like domain-containing protein [Planctomycetaceae bacterium]
MQRLTSNPVQQLRRILHDQYSFGSIVKELIQNADDARAREFHLGWVPSWPRDVHPLLTGPTLLCLNDGEFQKADAKAICRLDEGAKGADTGTIGKYGLGMKSVFHLCEGFFYAASPDQPAADGKPFVELLNPWPEGGPHDSWADTEHARNAIIECLSAWRHESKRWFCLVIPLRTP